MDSWQSLNRQISACERCSRLRAHCQEIAAAKRRAFQDWDYWGKPVPNFGDRRATLLVVGLAPAAHGANRTGRMFTGDRSGEWLYRALHRFGFANQPTSTSARDGLRLLDCAITAVCHCAPPANKPTPLEIANCRNWFDLTMTQVHARVFVALGRVAWSVMLQQAADRRWWQGSKPAFAHGACVPWAGGRWLIGSYHPSQQNTFTGRLTEPMFDQVFRTARELVDGVR
jgi:uracil-DNA glycosylase family 4